MLGAEFWTMSAEFWGEYLNGDPGREVAAVVTSAAQHTGR